MTEQHEPQQKIGVILCALGGYADPAHASTNTYIILIR